MEYPLLATVFFASLLLFLMFVIGVIAQPSIWKQKSSKIKVYFAIWFVAYFVFILFFTGPEDLNQYPPQIGSPYKLPWANGVSRLVAQGNRSFTSHRGTHRFAWDFVMPNGTQILAARDGRIREVEDKWDGIGLNSNFISVEHQDGQISVYAHIGFEGALVEAGDFVKQGQPIALSGMVGQTIFPHVHFYVLNKERTYSVPISFSDVQGGVPLAGHLYTSENSAR